MASASGRIQLPDQALVSAGCMRDQAGVAHAPMLMGLNVSGYATVAPGGTLTSRPPLYALLLPDRVATTYVTWPTHVRS